MSGLRHRMGDDVRGERYEVRPGDFCGCCGQDGEVCACSWACALADACTATTACPRCGQPMKPRPGACLPCDLL